MENIWKNLRKWKKAVIFFADFVLCFFCPLTLYYAENRWNFTMFSMIFEILNGFTDHQNNDVPSGNLTIL